MTARPRIPLGLAASAAKPIPQVLGQQFAFGAMALAAGGKPAAKEQIEKLLVDGVEVGRHARSGPHARPAAQLQGQRAV